MLRPNHAEVGMIVAVIATIQLILILSVTHEFSVRPRASEAPIPLALTVLDYAWPKAALRH